jgi:hypothetical protein
VNTWLRQIDRTHVLAAFGVWLLSLYVYLQTMAPTVTFWDCGEFIAVSYILGIPHPPGTPLWVMVGKLFTWNPFIAEPSARINFLSTFSSSFTALFVYLIGVRILRRWFTDSGAYTKLLIYAGAAAGALFMAWGETQWFNSGEAEVYGLSLLMFAAAFWLTLVYFDLPDSPRANQVMLAVVYIAFLGIGVHMTTFLVLPVSALFFILKRETPVRLWFAAAAAVVFELYLIFALSSRLNEVAYYVPVLAVFIVFLLYLFSLTSIPRILLLMAGGFLVALAPLYGIIAGVITGNREPGAAGFLNVVGVIGVVAIILLGVWALVGYFRSKGAQRAQNGPSLLMGAIFAGATAIMVLLLSAGIRGYDAFLFLSAILLAGLALVLWRYIRWANLIAIAGSSLVMVGIMPFVYGLAGAALVLALLGLGNMLPGWKTGLAILLMAVIGFSVHFFIPIRSAQDPFINENSPKTVQTTINFLERKQYGSQSMVERMFQRRGEWQNQFGTWRRMGFWGFFARQYGLENRYFFIILMLGVFGIWEAIRRRPEVGLGLIVLIIISSIGLVLYMNFADGTRQHPVTGADYIEVRERDYFFTPAFVFFGLAIGLGITGFIQFVRESLARVIPAIRTVALAGLSALFLLPTFALARNYFECDRSGNWLAYIYAHNILMSADRNAALFTYGDNDTFPVWCLQEAYGIRKDVRVINLSLGNTKWYIKQVQDYMGLRLGWTESDIDALRPYRTPDGRTFQLSDQLIDAVIQNNSGSVPVNFSTTVPGSSRTFDGKSADPYLELIGMAWRMTETAGTARVAVDEALSFFLDSTRFLTRSLDDPFVHKDENAVRLFNGYGSAILMVADSLRRAGRNDDLIRLLEVAHENLMEDQDILSFLASMYATTGQYEKLRALANDPRVADPSGVQVVLGRELYKAGLKAEGEAMLTNLLVANPTYRPALQELSVLYNQNREYSKMRTVLEIWVQANPSDTQVANLLRELERMISAGQLTEPGAGDTTR